MPQISEKKFPIKGFPLQNGVPITLSSSLSSKEKKKHFHSVSRSQK